MEVGVKSKKESDDDIDCLSMRRRWSQREDSAGGCWCQEEKGLTKTPEEFLCVIWILVESLFLAILHLFVTEWNIHNEQQRDKSARHLNCPINLSHFWVLPVALTY